MEFVGSDRGEKLGEDRLAKEYKEFVEKRLPVSIIFYKNSKFDVFQKSALISLSSCIDIWQEWGSIVSDEYV